MTTLADRIDEAVQAGHRKADIARACGVTPAAVSHWVKSRTSELRADHALALARLTGWRVEWWVSGLGPKVETGQALHMSQLAARVTPTRHTISWGEILGPLPERFSLRVEDDAMAPLLTRGDTAHFRATTEPRPGRPALVVDASGNGYIRLYEHRGAGRFRAVAMSPGYQQLDSEVDGLRVLAELDGWG